MKLTVKALSLLLCICLLIPTGVGFVLAEAPASSEPELSQAPFFDAAEGTERFDATLDLDTVPEIIGADAALGLGHVRRLYTAEKDLNTVYFKNADGTVTAYYFNHPVKYIDTDGSVKDITLDIEKKTTGIYGSKGGYASTVFAEKMTDGITLSGEGVSITLLPHVKGSTAEITPIKPGTSVMSSTAQKVPEAKADAAGKKISYAYDAKTSYEYSLTYSGFKEDIVVSEYTGQTTYTFTLKTGGLVLAEDEGGFYLLDEKGTEKGRLGRIIVFTADMKNNTFGSMSAKTLTEGEEYLLTIQLDAEYLRDERTKYPITIDPTIELTYESNSAGIHDIVINDKDELSGVDGEISAGKWGSDNSVSRILMKFPGLNLSDVPSADSIISAKVCIKDLMCQHEYLTLECYPFTGNVWNESNATWTNVGQPSTFTGLLDSHEISYFEGVDLETPHVYEFDITGAVRGWVDGSYDQDKGIIFKAAADHEADPTHNYKTFASFQRATNKPYVVVDYEFIDGDIIITDLIYLPLTTTIDLNDNIRDVPNITSITFSTNDNCIVSLNSNTGIITGQQLGTATISVVVRINDMDYTSSFNVCVILQDGVYTLQNHYLNCYLDVQDSNIMGDVNVLHFPYTGGGANQFWRIHHIGKGQYTLRPMHNPKMLLYASGNKPYVKEFTVMSEHVYLDSTEAWYIGYNDLDYGYYITNAGLRLSTSNDTLVAVEDDWMSIGYNDGYDEHLWTLDLVSFAPRILIYDIETDTFLHDTYRNGTQTDINRNIGRDEVFDLSSLGLKAVYSEPAFVNYTVVMNENSADIESSSSGDALVATSAGLYTITLTPEDANSPSATINLRVNRMMEGTFYLSSAYYEGFMETDSNGAMFADDYKRGVIGQKYQHWIFTNAGETDVFTIQSAVDNKYLAISSNSTFVWLDSPDNSALWYIGRDKNNVDNDEFLEKIYTISPYYSGGFIAYDGSGNITLTTTQNSSIFWRVYDVIIPIKMYYDESIEDVDEFIERCNQVVEFVNEMYGRAFNYVDENGKTQPVIEFKGDITNAFFFPIDTYTHNGIGECQSGLLGQCTDDCYHNCVVGHHKNSYAIAGRLYDKGRDGEISILFSSRTSNTFCGGYDVSHPHMPIGALGVVWNDYKNVIHCFVTDMNTEGENYPTLDVRLMSTLVLHELSHVFGLEDVYYDVNENPIHNPATPEEMCCVMSSYKKKNFEFFYGRCMSEGNNVQAYCPDCQSELLELLKTNMIE